MRRLFFLIFSTFIATCLYGQVPYSESFETGFGVWTQLTTDNFDWTQNSGPTPSLGTGPNAASDGNYYLYIEATGHNNPPQSAAIEAPFDFSGTTMPILSFDYHMYGQGIGFLHLWIFDGSNWKEVWNQLNEQGNQWNTVRLCLGDYANNANVKLKFSAETQYNDSSDIAIDNIKIVDFSYINETQTNVSCGNYSDGSIGITITGGFGPYEYSINDGIDYTSDAATNHTFSSLPGGDYPLKVKESSGCEIAGPVITLTEPQVPDISYTKDDVAPCIESKNGDFTINATGNYPPFTYSKDGFGGPFQASNTFSSLDTGNYQIAVKDNNGCIALGSTVNINCPTEIKILDETPTDVSTCFGDCNGAVSVTAGGGNAPLSYALDTSAALVFENSSYFSNLCVGTYRVIIEDNLGCRDTTNYVTINQPSLLILTTNNHTDVTGCYGDKNGTITLAGSGGTGTINYSIDNGTSFQTMGNFTSLDALGYQIIIRDQNNCQVDGGTVTINQPALLQIDSTTYKNVTGCFGNANGEIHIYAKGGTNPLKYSIDSGVTQVSTFDFTNLDVGNYSPYIEDANACNESANQITITQPTQLLITSVNVYDVNDCYGANTGSIQIFAAQGTEPYEYSIDNGANFQAIYTFSNVYAGTYQIIVRDANGCTKILDSLVTVKQPQQITITDELVSDVSCNGSDDGSVFVNASGGTGALLYSIDNGLTFPYSVGSYTYLPANSYQIAVKDENNCHISGSLLTINQPDSLLIDSITTADVDACYGDSTGTITIYARGGTSPLNYSIDNGANFQTDSIFNNLPAKTGYFPYVKDDNGCFVLGDQQTIGQPPQLIVTNQSHTDIDTCHGTPIGTISIQSNGGIGTIYYSINGINFLNNSGNFTNLYAGTYNIKIKDSKNCIANGWAETIIQPDTLLIDSVVSKNVKCSGLGNGEIYIYSSGGKSQINYSINNGLTYQVSSQFINLTPANYNIIVKDKYNCQVTSSATITEPPVLVLDSVIHTNVNTCNGDSTGTISIYGHGGTPTLEYAYSNVSSTPTNFVTSNIFNKVRAGSYYVTFRDQNACTETSSSFTITQPSIVQISTYNSTNVTCFGLNDGTISFTATGGTPGYEYSIDDGSTWYKNNGLFTSLTPNTYKLTLRDTNLCKAKYTYTELITQPDQLKISDFQHYNPTCFGYTDGQIIVFPSGGTSPYSYTLDDTLTQSQSTFDNLQEGQYWLTLTDKNNCVAQSDTVNIIMPTNKALFTSSIDSGCSPLSIKFTPLSTLAIFNWDFGDTIHSAVISPSHIFKNNSGATIDYIVTAIAEQNVCSDTARDTITVYSQPNISFDIDNSIHYFPDTNVLFSNIDASFSDYHWEFGDNTAYDGLDPISHNYPNCGNYNISLTAQNSHNCWDTTYKSVTMTSVDPNAGFIMDNNEGCEPLAVNFTNTSSTAVKYQWMYNNQVFSTDTNPHLEFSNSSNYLVTLKAYGYCNKIDSISKIIYVYPSPHLDFTVSPDTVGVEQDVVFQNNSTGAAYYVWDFGDGFYSGDDSPRRSYATPGTYSVILKGTSANSCSDSLELQNIIFVSDEFYFKLPTAFSPDGDGLNDEFKPYYNMVDKCRINIYSRRGNLVFRTDDFKNTFWDGTFNGHKLPIDTYIWEVSGTFLSGESFHSLGWVTIIR